MDAEATVDSSPANRRGTANIVGTGLTILTHPEPTRIGERVWLGAGRNWNQSLSRTEPLFVAIRTGRQLAIDHAMVSRRPVSLRASAAGVQIEVTPDRRDVLVDGTPLDGPRTIPWVALEEGIVIELGGAVALLLHDFGPNRRGQSTLNFAGDSDAIEALRADVLRVADLDLPALIRGQSGAGKELVARALHEFGPRRAGPFIAVNMAAVPETLAASELFGHVRGAFSGATGDSPGAFVRAHGGTLFLDEVGDTPPPVQAMLLRCLETREVTPLGGQRARTVDVRVVAATDLDLEAAMNDKAFRAPLFHRLSGFVLRVPPLRKRKDDVARLFIRFLREELDRIGEGTKLDAVPSPVTAPMMSAFVRRPWHGNVRELKNAVRGLAVANRHSPGLELPAEWQLDAAATEPSVAELPTPSTVGPANGRRHDVTDEELVAALKANGWKRGRAAAALGMARSTLYLRIDACPLIRKANTISREEAERALSDASGDVGLASERLEVSSRGFTLRLGELGIDLPSER